MQAQCSKQGASKKEGHEFEGEMRSAFWRGVTLLNESQSVMGEYQGEMTASSGLSHTGFNAIPKDVVTLKPVINLLMKKDLEKGAPQEWLSLARTHAEWLKNNGVETQAGMERLLADLKDEIALVDFLIETTQP